MLESAYNERNKVKNGAYVDEYVRHFIDNEPIPGIENEYAIMNQIVPNLSVEMVNRKGRIESSIQGRNFGCCQ